MKRLKYFILLASLFFADEFGFILPASAGGDAQTEQCFGAIGNKCDGGGNPVADVAMPPAVDRGNGMKRQWVSVGSILHDNCCLSYSDGQHCRGFNVQQEFMPDSGHCVLEWRKAFYQVRRNTPSFRARI